MNSPRLLFIALLSACCAVVACSPADIAKSLLSSGGGVKVAANTQLGKENNQTLGSVSNIDASGVDSLIVNNTSTMMLLALVVAVTLGVIGWALPTPSTLYKKWKNRAKQ